MTTCLPLLLTLMTIAVSLAAGEPEIAYLRTSAMWIPLSQAVTVSVRASDPDGRPLTCQWDMGDGTTVVGNMRTVEHRYARAGTYTVTCRVGNGLGEAVRTVQQRVVPPIAAQPGRRSRSMIADATRLWVANTDNGIVTCVDLDGLERLWEAAVGGDPRGVDLIGGTLWVACADQDLVVAVGADDGRVLRRVPLRYGARPVALVAAPDGGSLYVACAGAQRVLRLDATTAAVTGELTLPAQPRALAITSDGARLVVTRFISDGRAGTVWLADARRMTLDATVPLPPDTTPDSENGGRGLPNHLVGVTIDPSGGRAWVAAKKDNLARGLTRDGETMSHHNTVRALACAVDLDAKAEDGARRIDLDDLDQPTSLAFAAGGSLVFATHLGAGAVSVHDAATAEKLTSLRIGHGAIDGWLDEAGQRLFVHCWLDRQIVALDISPLLAGTIEQPAEIARIDLVTAEALAEAVLTGKRIFHDSGDPRMALQNYMNCATCHADGGQDGQVWDFTERGEGLRNTISLRGRAGTGHGPLHWAANFDEIQDFEHDIRIGQGGLGFLDDAHFAQSLPLGMPKAGLSAELDAIATYVASLSIVGRSPHRTPAGDLTAEGERGRTVFATVGCLECHGGAAFTDSASKRRHDVGTRTAASGLGRGVPIDGFDTPTLRGLWDTAPYFHDGSAGDLAAVLRRHGRIPALDDDQRRDLVAYLLQIDDREPAAPDPGAPR